MSHQVSAMVGNLRNMANDMGNELERQNAQVERINLKAGSDITRVKMANDTAAQLMKWKYQILYNIHPPAEYQKSIQNFTMELCFCPSSNQTNNLKCWILLFITHKIYQYFSWTIILKYKVQSFLLCVVDIFSFY